MIRLVEVIVGSVVGALVAFAVLLPQVGDANAERDLYRTQINLVRDRCAVRVADGYAECKPGAIVWGTTTTVQP